MTKRNSVIIFDTDGTLMDGRCAVIDAVAEGLNSTYRHFELPVPEPDRERISLAMGLPTSTFFRTAFTPHTVPADMHDPFACEFEIQSTRAEIAALRDGKSQLYEGAKDTLTSLRDQGHDLALFSNASEPYFQTVIEVHRLDHWFGRALSLEYAVRRRLARNKSGMIRYLSQGYKQVVVVGDRIHDIEAGKKQGALTVGCVYGFGAADELKDADWRIERLSEILALPLSNTDAEQAAKS